MTGDVYISNWAIEDELQAAVDLVPAIEVPEQATVLRIDERREL